MSQAERVHPINRWRLKHGIKLAAFARMVGASRSSLSKVEHGERDRLSADVNLQVERVTGGKVTMAELTAWTWEDAESPRPTPRKPRPPNSATTRTAG